MESTLSPLVRSPFFSPALSGAGAGGGGLFDDRLGEVVTGMDDIHQAIHILLGTVPGSDPHRPTFGCDIWRHLDAPLSHARPRIVRDVIYAIDRWEPRVRVVRVTVEQTDIARLLVTVQWQLEGDATGQLFSTALPYSREAA